MKKILWLTIGHPATAADHRIAGGPLRLREARELAVTIDGLVKCSTASIYQIKHALEMTCAVEEFENNAAKHFNSLEEETVSR